MKISGYPVFKNRNPFQNNLKTLAELFIEDLASIPVQEEEFFDPVIQRVVRFRSTPWSEETSCKLGTQPPQQQELKIDTLRAVAGHKGEVASEFTSELLAKGLRRRPIVLLERVGVGKTMFLRNLLRVEAKKELERAAVFYIDFLKGPALVTDLRTYILRRCRDICWRSLVSTSRRCLCTRRLPF